ncbi:MAG TPA: hypothetical protein VLT33_29745 [Labilithrix sp.]|nr:hypothetical protein [Labilithrix sp.]
MRLLIAIVLVAAASISSTVACSSSSSSGSDSCSSNPFSCDVGQTCSAKDKTGVFACLTSGSGKKGDACQNTPGVTTCGDGLVCLQLVASGGTCASFCEVGNAAHGCGTGETCSLAGLAGTSTTFHVCAGGAAPADAGATDAADQ